VLHPTRWIVIITYCYLISWRLTKSFDSGSDISFVRQNRAGNLTSVATLGLFLVFMWRMGTRKNRQDRSREQQDRDLGTLVEPVDFSTDRQQSIGPHQGVE